MRRLLFLLLIAILAGFGWWRYQTLVYSRSHGFTPADGPRIDPKNLQILSALDAEYQRLAEAVVPSVVSITSRTVAPGRRGSVDLFELLFGPRGRAEQLSLGSGVIVSKEGHVLTNFHVIKGTNEIAVQIADGRQVPARFIGADQSTDIAVLQITAPNLVPLPLGDSDAVHVGQIVFAVGNPFGLRETVTQGIISARGRRLQSDSRVELLQTDAAVNKGNSGGPLINLRGEIVGINTSIYSENGGNIGISFAVPANTVRQTLESVLKTGRADRGYMGVVLQAMTPELAAELGSRDMRGVIVAGIAPGSPAEAAGLQPGDILRKLGDRNVTSPAEVRSIIAGIQVGAKLPIVFERAGSESTTDAVIAAAPDMPLTNGGP